MEAGLFEDLLVIDCASFIAGPAAATMLGDFGARVIKIEPPVIGDTYRQFRHCAAPRPTWITAGCSTTATRRAWRSI